MIVIGHRGASADAPENTFAAFDLALSMGVDALETDLRQTRDGVIVLLHDARVDRTTDGHGPIDELSWSDVQMLDAGAWKDGRFTGERIPRLDAFLDRYGAVCPLYLEIKAPSAAEPALAQVRQRGLLGRVVFTSFDLEVCARMTRLAEVRTGWLVQDWTNVEAERAATVGLSEVSVNAARITRALAERIRAGGLDVRAWGLKDDLLIRRALEAGVSGVTVDFPDRLIRLLGTGQQDLPRGKRTG